MSDELARVLAQLLDAVEAYDREQPVQTRLMRKHDAMTLAMSKAKEALEREKARMLDGGPSPEYVVHPSATGTAVGVPICHMDGSRDGDYVSPPIIDYGTAGDPSVSRIIP